MINQNKKTILNISGMHCASCALLINRSLQALPGVKQANVNYANEQALIEHDEACSLEQIKKTITNTGYKVIENDIHSSHDMAELSKLGEFRLLKIKLVISGVLTTLLLLGAMMPDVIPLLSNSLVMLVLATPVQFWVGAQYYKSAMSALKMKTANMDTLIALGTSVAYVYSLFTLIFRNTLNDSGLQLHVYFETSATIITLILTGKYLEARAKSQTSTAIKNLIGLQVKTALLLRDGQKIEVSVDEVKIGDILIVKPGAKIPIDGEIIEGESYVDESMVTGESVPVFKSIGTPVIGATINKSGYLRIKVTKNIKDTMLSQIIQMVKEAQGSRAQIQQLVDKISSYFVPAVIILSLITFIIWFIFGPYPSYYYAIINLISVLIIACPCALGLATPTSLVVGMGNGATKGILIKDAQSLEVANKIKYIVFDKTGTLTEGHPKVQHFEIAGNIEEIISSKLLPLFDKTDYKKLINNIIYSIEKRSHHPIAEAVVQYLTDAAEIEISEFKDIPGFGVIAKVNNHEIFIGNAKLMDKEGIVINPSLVETNNLLSQKKHSVFFVSIDHVNVALISVFDSIKQNAPKVISDLKRMGIVPVMITGDNSVNANAIAQDLGINEVISDVLPNQKAEKIKQLQLENGIKNIVVMVGDGINDAPALATADVAIAMGSGTDVAIESAGITLIRGDLSLVPMAIALSKATMRNIKQNLFWAFGYNVLLIPVAMGALYPFWGILLNPMLASTAMALSSVSVVANSLRLKRFNG